MPEPPSLHRTNLNAFEEQLRRVTLEEQFANRPVEPIDQVAFYDFATYEYLLPTESGFHTGTIGLSQPGLALLDQMQISGWSPLHLDWFVTELELFEDAVTAALTERFLSRANLVNTLLTAVYTLPPPNIFTILDEVRAYLDSYGATREDKWAIYHTAARSATATVHTQQAVTRAVVIALEGDIFVATQTYVFNRVLSGPPPLARSYPFEVFPNYTINLGLRLIYRQEWKPLGTQPGEIVTTVPMAPGYKERITFKVVRRDKRTKSLEFATEEERTEETTDSKKDSAEVVREAAESFNWSEDLDLGGKFLGIGAESKTHFGGNEEEKTRQTSSHLSESVRKAASKLRRQTKVVVSTESEVTVEQEKAAEISNPNNEVPLTYEYQRLQHQFEVFTYLAEVQSVIYVAERVPPPSEIGPVWVRKHDWILARALKDESHRATLNELIQDEPEVDPVQGLANNPFESMQSVVQTKFANFIQGVGSAGQQGDITIPDIYSDPQRLYQQYLQEKMARDRANSLRDVRRRRLYEHFRDHILYYCRAIWAAEDPDQRILRYKKEGRRVPIEWVGPAFPLPYIPEQFLPAGATLPLWELIEPTGPIGYSGNYAVFRLRPIPRRVNDVSQLPPLEVPDPIGAPGPIPLPQAVVSLGFLLALLRAPYVGDATVFGGRYEGVLLDPALRDYWLQTRGHTYSNLDDQQARDVASYLPRLAPTLFAADSNGSFLYDAAGFPVVARDATGNLLAPPTPDDYAEYLYRKNGTRRFLVDSNNLYLSIRLGAGVALEPFKRAHRYIDVFKEYEALLAEARKNERRVQHVADPAVYDPDVEKVIIIGAGGSAVPVAVNEALTPRGAPPPATTEPASGGTA